VRNFVREADYNKHKVGNLGRRWKIILKWILEKQFVVLNGTEEFQYHRMWGSDMNSVVHSGCGCTDGYFASQST